jgi:hypothetical protein
MIDTRNELNRAARRRSLLALGGVILASATTSPWPVQAGKQASKAKKRVSKKCGRQVAACRDAITERCLGNPQCEDDLPELLPCCERLSDCKAGASLDCFFSPPPQ